MSLMGLILPYMSCHHLKYGAMVQVSFTEVESMARDFRLGSNTMFIKDMDVEQRVESCWSSKVKQSKLG